MATAQTRRDQADHRSTGARLLWIGIPLLIGVAAIGVVLGIQVIDGDPAVEQFEAGGKVKRLSGHKLELKDGREVEFAAVRLPYDHEPYAAKSREVLTKWMEDEGVRLRFDEYRKDDDQRIVAYVYANDTFINQRLVRDGLAFVKLRAGNRQFAEALLAAQAEARQEEKGIWQNVPLTSTGRFVGDPERGTFHRPECVKIGQTESPGVELQGTIQAIDLGMSPCGKCDPLGN